MWLRLGRLWLRAIVPAIGVVVALVAVEFGLTVGIGKLSAGFDADIDAIFPIGAAMVVVAMHGLFIAVLSDHLLTQGWRVRSRAIIAGLALTVPIALFAYLDASGASYGCADGHVTAQSSVPMWPWAWGGWLLLAVSALPSRLLGYPVATLEPWPNRVMMLAPFAVVVLITGMPFQRRSINCSPPFNDGWGLFEGGIVLIPLLALFLFSMTFSLAVLSAAYVRPPQESQPS